MSNYTDQTTSSPILNFYSSASQLTSQPNPSVTELHMIPAGGVSLPSDRYIDFTLPASGSNYRAPADGWVIVAKISSATNQFLHFQSYDSNGELVGANTCYIPSSGLYVACSVPVSSGCNVGIWYTLGGNTEVCRFVYANGAPNVSA